MAELNRQQICAELGVSESTIRRLEQQGLPYTPVGKRSHRYDLVECKAWLRNNPPGAATKTCGPRTTHAAQEFMDSCRKVKLRVMPS